MKSFLRSLVITGSLGMGLSSVSTDIGAQQQQTQSKAMAALDCNKFEQLATNAKKGTKVSMRANDRFTEITYQNKGGEMHTLEFHRKQVTAILDGKNNRINTPENCQISAHSF